MLLHIFLLLSFGTSTVQSNHDQIHHRVLLVVEPTPFTYISGYANRFKEMLKHLKDAGDEVHILTPDDSENPPTEYLGFPITTLSGYRLWFYNHITLSIDYDGRINSVIESFKPDVIHISTPGTVVFPTIYYAYKHKLVYPSI
jgi:sulfoquinovosyltransferase